MVVNGIPYRETVLPTRLSTSSALGLNLNVMDTPRNTTLLSTTQLETLNIDDPRAFSYLTSSSYTDAAFGTPNIPRVRTQYADLFYNGMRDSLTQNGYGVPVNFDALANIAITKGPASVIDGPGPGVGGEVDLLTKRPNLTRPHGDGVGHVRHGEQLRRWVVDASTPIIPGDLAVLLSYSGENSDSYFYGHYMHKNALYAELRWEPNDKYTQDFNTEINVEQYTENVGVNRANQALIDSGQYLQGGVAPADVDGFLTFFDLSGTKKIDPRITIDETPGTSTRGLLYNAQLIQSYNINDHLSIESNTLFMVQDSDNQEGYYYADNSNGSFTIESRTDLKGDYDLTFGGATIKNQFVVGGTFRFAHTNYISDFNAEAVSAWDLTGNPADWNLNPVQQDFEDAVPYKSVFGRIQYGVLGRDFVSGGNTGVSDLNDGALFFQDRMEFNPKFSLLFGGRIDALQDHTHDPLGCVARSAMATSPASPTPPAFSTSEPAGGAHDRRLWPRQRQRQRGLQVQPERLGLPDLRLDAEPAQPGRRRGRHQRLRHRARQQADARQQLPLRGGSEVQPARQPPVCRPGRVRPVPPGADRAGRHPVDRRADLWRRTRSQLSAEPELLRHRELFLFINIVSWIRRRASTTFRRSRA